MIIKDIIDLLTSIAPPQLQESYDNAGLLTGNASAGCTGIIVSLDVTEAVVAEAVEKNCNLIVAHHPVIFGGLKSLTGRTYVERTVLAAIKNDIAIYAIHTNLDNVIDGVNGKIADLLGLIKRQPLLPKRNLLKKLFVFVPVAQASNVRNAIFAAGGGHIGNYSECSFNAAGTGTFLAGDGATPFAGNIGERHTEEEIKVEVVFQAWKEQAIVKAMLAAHPYEEVAYDIVLLENQLSSVGSGLLGELATPLSETAFLNLLKSAFNPAVIKHTAFTGRAVKKVAVCGGSGSFLTKNAVAAGADFYVTADIKYHEFFDAENRLVLADIGHFESEQHSISLVFDILKQKYPTFAVLKTGINTNPVHYFF